jgi:hypothetical protein
MEHSKSADVNPRSLIDDAHDAIRVQANYYSVNIDEGRGADPTSAHHRRNPTLPTGCRGHIGAPLNLARALGCGLDRGNVARNGSFCAPCGRTTATANCRSGSS